MFLTVIRIVQRVSKNVPTLAICSFDNHGLIFIILANSNTASAHFQK